MMAPWSRHFCSISRYSVILFCRFLAAIRLSGLMFSRPMNTRRTPACAAFSMKFGILWHSVSTWIVKPMFMPFAVAQLDQAVEQRFPVAVAGEIVVGDEEALDALRVVLAHDAFEIVGGAEPALAALHVDDGAERALVGAAAAEIDARQRAGRAAHMLARQDRRRLALAAPAGRSCSCRAA